MHKLRLICLFIFILKINSYNNFVVLPDTQYYSAYWKEIFEEQTYWICNCLVDDVLFVSHLGDLVEHENRFSSEWKLASHAMKTLDTCNIPYGVLPGNHDSENINSSLIDYSSYLKYFGPDINTYSVINLNNGEELIWIHIQFFFDIQNVTQTFEWVSTILERNKTTFISSHFIGSDNPMSTTILVNFENLVKNYCNLKALFNGHTYIDGGENLILTENNCNNFIPNFVSDYQGRRKGGYGWLRYYQYDNIKEKFCVYTFSPILNELEFDENSFFSYYLNGTIDNGCNPLPNIFTCKSTFLRIEFYFLIVGIFLMNTLGLFFLYEVNNTIFLKTNLLIKKN